MNTKEEYLLYQKEWKRKYKETSESIKENKLLLKCYQRMVKINFDHNFSYELKRYSKYILEDRKIATKLLNELKLEKKKANKQYYMSIIKNWFKNSVGFYK